MRWQILESRSGLVGHAVRGLLPQGRSPAVPGAVPRGPRSRSSWRPACGPATRGVALALGWCYKRTNRLAQAIDALDRARRHDPENALLHYNLACYWSLAGNPAGRSTSSRRRFDLDPKLRDLIADEPDFRHLRGNPDFDRLVIDSARSK